MNIAAIYQDAIGEQKLSLAPVQAEMFSPAEHAASVQSKLDWLAHIRTKEVFEKLEAEINTLMNQAIALACSSWSWL